VQGAGRRLRALQFALTARWAAAAELCTPDEAQSAERSFAAQAAEARPEVERLKSVLLQACVAGQTAAPSLRPEAERLDEAAPLRAVPKGPQAFPPPEPSLRDAPAARAQQARQPAPQVAASALQLQARPQAARLPAQVLPRAPEAPEAERPLPSAV